MPRPLMENQYQMNRKDPRSRNLRTHRCDEEYATFFITKSLQPKKAVLISSGLAQIIVDTIRHHVEDDRILLSAFVVMPDHWHWLFYTRPPHKLPALMHAVDTWIGAKSKKQLGDLGCAWQDGYYDTRIRSTKQFFYVRNYIRDNPVKGDLVGAPEDWVWSSWNSQHEELITHPWPWGFEQDKD